MSFEDNLPRLAEHFFFSEFVYSATRFRSPLTTELELADQLLWIDDLLVIHQLKERHPPAKTDNDRESRWFDRKVIGVGSRQIRDTLRYLEQYSPIEVENRRGHRRRLDKQDIRTIHKVICYEPGPDLPATSSVLKYHPSESAGIIHLLPAEDYSNLLRVLLTPAEFSEYLTFRTHLIGLHGAKLAKFTESALLGQYLAGEYGAEPDQSFADFCSALDHRIDEWDMSGIVRLFPHRITATNVETDYYAVITEVAKLKRSELREFRLRFEAALKACRKGDFQRPFRMMTPRTGCAFVFIPLPTEQIKERQAGLINLTAACKYDLRADKCIGASFAPDADGWFLVDWCAMEFPWRYDSELSELLDQNNPFREVAERTLEPYTFRDAEENT